MSTLLEFQRTMAQAVMQPLSRQDNMRRGNRQAASLVKPNSRLTAFERLEIYNRSYWSRVLDAFTEDFPGVRGVVGARRFERLRREYLADCPSTSFTMRDLGSQFVRWLQRHSSLAGPQAAAAVDMAKLEWAEVEAFDAAEHAPLTPAEAATLDSASRLRLQPYLRLIELNYAVDELIVPIRESAQRNGGVPRAMPARRILRARAVAPIFLAVHRHELVVHYRRLDGEAYRLLSALSAGQSIADAADAAYATSLLSPEASVQHLNENFAIFAALGWFTASAPSGELL